MSAYEKVIKDPNHQEIVPGVVMLPFHVPLPGRQQDWHVYCERHPMFGFCGDEAMAKRQGRYHAVQHWPRTAGGGAK